RFAISLRFEAIGIDAAMDESLPHNVGAFLTELHVETIIADIIGVPLHPDPAEFGVTFDHRTDLVEERLALGLDLGRAGVELNLAKDDGLAVFDRDIGL